MPKGNHDLNNMKHWRAISERELMNGSDKARSNAWRVSHKNLNKTATSCGVLATVKKEHAEHWAKMFEEIAPTDDEKEVFRLVNESGIISSFSSWMAFKHGASSQRKGTQFWPSEFQVN